MGKFSKIKKYSKSSSLIDEKIRRLNTDIDRTMLREAPTNSTSSLYIIEPDRVEVTPVEPTAILDLEADDSDQSGTDTSGLFDEYGNSILVDPPGTWEIPDGATTDPSPSLGPMVSYYDSSADITYLGYVRESDRSMINLGRIDGTILDWDGSSNFTSYGQLTLAQAQWYQGESNNSRVQDYRVFYSGKSDSDDPYNRVLAKVINTPKTTESNPWAVYTNEPISSDQEITVKFYFDGGSEYANPRPPIYYDSNGDVPSGLGNQVDTVNFTVPSGSGFNLQQGQNSGSFNVHGIGLKWRYLRGSENVYGHDEPDGDRNGRSTNSHPDDYFVWFMNINGTDYRLPTLLQGMTAAIGIPGYTSDKWTKGSANSQTGYSSYNTSQQLPPSLGGLDSFGIPGLNNIQKMGKDFVDTLSNLWNTTKDIVDDVKILNDKASEWVDDTLTSLQDVPIGTAQAIVKSLKPLEGLTGKGLGSEIQLAWHGTSQDAADRITAKVSDISTKKQGIAGFKPGSSSNIYRTTGVFAEPGVVPGPAAKEFSKSGGQVGRNARQRFMDLLSGSKKTGSDAAGAIIPTAYPRGSGPGMNIPFTKYKEVSASATKATKGTELATKILNGAYPKSVKAQQLIKTGKTTASIRGAKSLAKVAGRLSPGISAGLAAADVAIRGNNAANKFRSGDIVGGSFETVGALLGALTAVPGPIGWTALGAQFTWDAATDGTPASTNPVVSKRGNTFSNFTGGSIPRVAKEEYIFEQKLNTEKMFSEYLKYSTLLAETLKSGMRKMGIMNDNDIMVLKQISEEGISPLHTAIIISMVERINSKRKNKKTKIKESAQLLNEDKVRIIREVKKPYILPEAKKEKIKHRPKVIGAPPRSVGADMMKQAECPTSFKPLEEKMWGKHERNKNIRASQERKNQVLDFVGTSDNAFEWITKNVRNKGKKIAYENFNAKELLGDALYIINDESGKKSYKLQSEINDDIFKFYFGKYLNEQEEMVQSEIEPKDQTLFKRISKRAKTNLNFDYEDKPSKNGYPDQPPPQMVNGWHPEYGKDRGYYNKLDPHSAAAMPPTGNPEIDAKVRRARRLKNIFKNRA